MRDRFPRSLRVALALAMVPAGVFLAALVSSGPGTAAATAATNIRDAGDTTTTSSSTSLSATTSSSTTTSSKSTSSTSTTTAAAVPVSECTGELSLATPTIDDPHLLNYSFHCNGQVNAYSVIVSRPGQAYNEVDDINSSGNVIDPSTGQQSSTEGFNCSGTIPGSGFNCLTATTGTSADPWSLIQGQFDTTTPFCPSLPSKKPGTKPTDGAVAYLVVNDPTGEQEGPWLFQMSPKCPAVKAVPKKKAKKG